MIMGINCGHLTITITYVYSCHSSAPDGGFGGGVAALVSPVANTGTFLTVPGTASISTMSSNRENKAGDDTDDSDDEPAPKAAPAEGSVERFARLISPFASR
jgi:hypothetical protein